MNKNLYCPIRGELNILELSADDLTFSEEYQRIECIKFLLNKKDYPREHFEFEKNILKYGNKGRNSLRADIVVYDKPKNEIGDEKVKHIVLVAEIKRNNEQRSEGIEKQLKPAMNHCPNVEYGIYWDNEIKILFRKSEQDKVYNLLKLPVFNSKWEDKILSYSDLEPITDSKAILTVLEQKIHNLGVTSLDRRYSEIFKIIITKYYDETKNKKSDHLEFQVLEKEENNKEKFLKRMNDLYSQAREYYSSNSPINLDKTLQLKGEHLINIVKILEGFSFLETNSLLLQDFFMYFAPVFLRKELDQYYTPQEIVNFMVSIIKLKTTDCAIDPAGGSGDFLTGIIKKGYNLGLEKIKENIHYWDISPDALNVASLNMILNGDGRTNIKEIDSIEKYDKNNNFFQFCLTNPPFGKDTIWDKDIEIMEHYDLGYKYQHNKSGRLIKTDDKIKQQLGILFIERSMQLLKRGGILEIIVPNGYLTNSSMDYIRKYLFENYRIIASVLLPEDVFKKSDASGFPVILIVKKERMEHNYKIFTAVARKIGFEHTSIKVPKLYLRDEKTGEYILNQNNEKIPQDDLLLIAKQFKKFAFDNDINNFEQENNGEDYSYTTRDNILKYNNLVLCAKRSNKEYLQLIKKIQKEPFTTLKDMGAEVTNALSFEKDPSKEYVYLDTGELFTGYYKKANKLRGWDLPNRAKQSVNKNDILIAKTRGCFDKFCMILEDNSNIVATNGFYRIRINDEKERLNFYHYLFTEDFKKQMEVLATGTILTDVKEEDIIERLLIPTNQIAENYNNMKKFIAVQKELYSSF